MQRKPNIKWRKSDEAAIGRALKNFNAKINRVEQRAPDTTVFQPSKITGKARQQLLEELKTGTRQDFNRKLKEIQRYSKKGAEKIKENNYGVGITEWQLKNMQNEARAINVKRAQERKKVQETEATSRGKPLGMKRSQMEDTRDVALRPKKFEFNKMRSMKELEKMKESLVKQSQANYENTKNERYKANYITSIMNSDIPENLKQEIINAVKDMPPEKFVEMYYKEEQASITFSYDPADAKAKGDIILNIWKGEAE